MVIVLSLGFEAGKQGWANLVLSPGATNTNGVPFLGDNNLVAVGIAMLLPMVGALGITSSGWQRRAYGTGFRSARNPWSATASPRTA